MNPESVQAVREELLDLYFQVGRFMRVAEGYGDSYSTCLETEGHDLRVKLFCKDPSSQLEEALKRSRSAVFFSATLTPASYFQRILGCDETAKTLLLPSPFPREKLCLLVSDRISTLYRQRENTKQHVARELIELVDKRKGNYLLFFPSYAYMTMVHSLVSSERPDMQILLQAPDMTEEDRDDFLAEFRADNGKTLIGFAVMGGVFGEGIDLVGDRLTGAAVVGVGLPAVSPERELIKEHFDRSGVGFDYAYVFPGINRVLQAAGRVIRSEADRGAVLLIDQRFGNARYRSLFPREWQPVFVKDQKHLRRSLERFWSEQV
jgi:DNA excision repair protein ERCC-2